MHNNENQPNQIWVNEFFLRSKNSAQLRRIEREREKQEGQASPSRGAPNTRVLYLDICYPPYLLYHIPIECEREKQDGRASPSRGADIDIEQYRLDICYPPYLLHPIQIECEREKQEGRASPSRGAAPNCPL